MFSFTAENAGISGAMAKGANNKLTKDGVVVYFKSENMNETLGLALENGGQARYPKMYKGIGLVAEFRDLKGNKIALFQAME